MADSKNKSAKQQGVRNLLSDIRGWMTSAEERVTPHPSDEEMAAYLDWLGSGAAGDWPAPEVNSHIGSCPACYRMVCDLRLAHLEAERAMAAEGGLPGRLSIVIHLVKELRDSVVESMDEAGRSIRKRLGDLVPFPPPIGLMAESVSYMMDFSLPAPRVEESLAERAEPAGAEDEDYPEALISGLVDRQAPWCEIQSRRADQAAGTIPVGPLEVSLDVHRAERGYDLTAWTLDRRSGDLVSGVSFRILDHEGHLIQEGKTRKGEVVLRGLALRTYQMEIIP